MEARQKGELCIKGLCKIIEDYCNGQKCPRSKPLGDVKAVYMVFFRGNGKARMHLIGEMSIGDLIASTQASVNQILEENNEGSNPLAS